MTATSVLRSRLGAYSFISATTLGITAAAEPGEEAENAELDRSAGEAVEHGGAAEQHETDGDALCGRCGRPGAERQCAEHHAEQRITAQCARFQRVSPHSFMITGSTTP